METVRDRDMTVKNEIEECMREQCMEDGQTAEQVGQAAEQVEQAAEQVEQAADKANPLKGLKQLLAEEEGMGTVEVILIIVVLVGLVLIFKSQITSLVGSLFQKITNQANGI